MSKFKFNCLHCQGLLEAETEWSGKMTTCPLCQKSVHIPAPKVTDDSVIQVHAASNSSETNKNYPGVQSNENFRTYDCENLNDSSSASASTPVHREIDRAKIAADEKMGIRFKGNGTFLERYPAELKEKDFLLTSS